MRRRKARLLDTAVLVTLVLLHLLALVDIAICRLAPGAKVLWALLLVFMPVVGLAGWMLTRHTAHQQLTQ